MKPADRKAFVEGKAKERAELQQKIQTLNAEREKFVQEELKKRADKNAPSTVDQAVIDSAKTEAAVRDWSL